VTPVLGISGVGGAMAIYGASDVVVSETINLMSTLSCKFYTGLVSSAFEFLFTSTLAVAIALGYNS
jgi:hypothetical protein